MQPLRAAVGWGEPVDGAARRLALHEADLAPVVERGRPAGLLTRDTAEAAARVCPASTTAGAVASGPPSSVPLGAGLPALWRAACGTAPGVLVRGPAGAVRGVVSVTSLGRLVDRARGSARPPAWLREPDLSSRMDRLLDSSMRELLRRAGVLAAQRGLPLYLVGGMVRDLLRGVPGRDPDLIVEGDAIGFARALGAMLGARVVSHPSFGTAELRLPSGHHVDVITARRESYPEPGVLPRVKPSTVADDLRRRDVTINAMAVRLEGAGRGRLRDDLGGWRDLRARLLRVHHPLSLTDDPTRALRIARLAARLGYGLADETRRSLELARLAEAPARVSGTRLWREFSRVAAESDPVAALSWLARLDLLGWLGPGLGWDGGARRAARAFLQGRGILSEESASRVHADLVLLAILAHGATTRQRAAVASRLSLQGEAAVWIVEGDARARDLAGRLARAGTLSRAVRAWEKHDVHTQALAWAHAGPDARRAMTSAKRARRAVAGAVTGDTLRALGLPPGPAYAAILRRVRNAWLDGTVRDAREAVAMASRLARRAALTSPEER